MKKAILWIVTALFLILALGIVILSLAMPCEFETHQYEIKENFSDIIILADTADVQFMTTENQSSFVVCEEEKNENHTVTVKDNTLRIEVVDNKKWYEEIAVNLRTPKITVYSGKGEYDNISLKTDTGNILLNNLNVTEKFEAKTDTGNVTFENGKANDIFVETDTGNVLLDNVVANRKLEIETDTGNVVFNVCDASEVLIETDTGNVTGSFLTDKVVFAESDTGNIDIPKVIADEKCEIITDTGNIKITIEQGNKNS